MLASKGAGKLVMLRRESEAWLQQISVIFVDTGYRIQEIEGLEKL